jgi:dGTPase
MKLMDLNSLNLKDSFSKYASNNSCAIRKRVEKKLIHDFRQPFSIDSDRIINSKAYARYIDKTQVFSLIENDHITHRVLHVQLVSKIARTIGRFLNLNEDLIEAISLAHDIGHAPFGHDGEKILSDICEGYGLHKYKHNVQSVHFLENVEKNGKGLNLSLQTLDGILNHNGETHDTALSPVENRNFDDIAILIENILNETPGKYEPMTLEACVVRFSDTVSYIGRDIEDAIILGIINRDDLPSKSCDILGKTNGTIVYNLVSDIIKNSLGKNFIAYSDEVSKALKKLKEFNLENIYMNKNLKSHLEVVKDFYKKLFNQFVSDLNISKTDSVIYRDFLDYMDKKYIEKYSKPEIVRDFIGGMTDQYFINQIPLKTRPLKYRILN